MLPAAGAASRARGVARFAAAAVVALAAAVAAAAEKVRFADGRVEAPLPPGYVAAVEADGTLLVRWNDPDVLELNVVWRPIPDPPGVAAGTTARRAVAALAEQRGQAMRAFGGGGNAGFALPPQAATRRDGEAGRVVVGTLAVGDGYANFRFGRPDRHAGHAEVRAFEAAHLEAVLGGLRRVAD